MFDNDDGKDRISATSKGVSSFPVMAPFSAVDVVKHAETSPKIYEMEYLKSNVGQQHIQQVINSINEGVWPQEDGVKGAWDKGRISAGYNKSLIGYHVSQEYERSVQGLPPAEKTVKKLQAQGLIAGAPQKIKVMFPKDSAHTDKVIFMTGAHSPKLVAKVFKDIPNYESESMQLSSEGIYAQKVNELRHKSNVKLPLLMEYKGATIAEGQGVVLLTKAKGQSLKEISDKIIEKSDENIIKIFRNIGSQLGRLDSLLYLNNNKNRLIHPDSHLANFTYDEKTDQLYWIDTAGIRFHESYPSLRPITFVNNQLRNFVLYENKKDEYNYPIYVPFYFKDYEEEDAKRFHLTSKKHLLALKSLYEGYGSGMKENGLDLCPLIEEYENTFKLQMNVNGNSGSFEEKLEEMNEQFLKRKLPSIILDEYNKLNLKSN